MLPAEDGGEPEMTDSERIIERLELEIANAREVYEKNKRDGEPVQSTAFDSGRYSGLKDALEIVLSETKDEHRTT